MKLHSAPQNVGVNDGHGNSASLGDFSDGQTKTAELALDRNASALDFTGSGGSLDWTLTYNPRTATDSPAVDLDGDGTNDVSHSGVLSDGQTETYQASSLGLTDDTATVSTASGSTVDVAVNLEEVTKTRDPSLTLNGTTVASYAGVISDGATVDRNVSQSELKAGQNNLTVNVGDGTLSNDAPTPSVGFEYDHSADVKIDTSYVDDGWRESYNVSHTYADDRQNVQVTIPFSRTIYEVRTVEYQVNGGGWTTVSSSNWNLVNGTRLEVTPPDTDGTAGYEASDKLEVRTAGYKVRPVNGAITVTDPTDPADSTVDAKFTVDNQSSGFHLELQNTKNGERVHYLASASWARDETAVFDADGSQDLYLPNAQAGETARVTTLPLEARLSSGDVGIHVVDAGTPKFQVRGGPGGVGDEIELVYHNVTSGETYELYSVDAERPVDKDTAESPVYFLDDDSSETFLIQVASSDSGGSTGESDVSTGSWDDGGADGLLQELAVAISWAVLVVVLVGATGRSGLEGRQRWILVGSLAAGSGLLSLEVLRPGSVSGAVNVGLQEVIPLAGLAAIGVVVYSVVLWWQSRKAEASTPETQVTLDADGSD